MSMRVIWRAGLAMLAAGYWFTGSAEATPTTYFVTTGQTGAQTQIDINHSATWAFTATSDWLLGGGNFTMKAGNNATADVILSVYLGTDATGTLLGAIDETEGGFCSVHGGNCQSFASTAFNMTPINIESGNDYYIALASSALDQQTTAYFIKGLGATVADNSGNVLAQSLTLSVPEPSSLLLIGGLIALGLVRLPTSRRA
jgi:hypothetical protein